MSTPAVHPKGSLGISNLSECIRHIRECYDSGRYKVDEKTGAYIALVPGPDGTNWWPTRITVDKRFWYVCPGVHLFPDRDQPPTIDHKEWELHGAIYDPKDFEMF